MKNKIFTFVLLILFFIGLSLLLYPTVSDYWNSFHQSRAIAGYAEAVEELDEEAYEKCLADARAYNAELVGDGGRFQPTAEETARYNSLLDIAGNGIMGYIEIPSIGVSLPVYHGVGTDRPADRHRAYRGEFPPGGRPGDPLCGIRTPGAAVRQALYGSGQDGGGGRLHDACAQ